MRKEDILRSETLLYSPANAARILDVSVRQLYRLIKSGQLKVAKVGIGNSRIARAELEAFVERAQKNNQYPRAVEGGNEE
jgi:excisionase family DNA binding protein